jgi:hypothetical protein
MLDPDLIEARATIAALQTALDKAHVRIRELEVANAAVNARLFAANDRADELELALWRLQAVHADADLSP